MKHKRRPYNNVVERKLEQLPDMDADHLWNGMHAILDKKMPQKKERRRFAGWLLTGKGLLLLSVISLSITGSFLFLLSKKQNSNNTINDVSNSTHSNKSIEDGAAIIPQKVKENATTTPDNDKTQDSEPNLTTEASYPVTESYAINNSFNSQQTKKDPEKYADKNQYNPLKANSETKTDEVVRETGVESTGAVDYLRDSRDFDITKVNLKSIHDDFVMETNYSEEKDSKPATGKNTKTNNERGFYAGIVCGVDLSSIHFRSVKTGATKGFIIGYGLNENWSVESGLLWDKKRFFDDGRYFSPAGYTPTPGTTITAVNGTSRLYEWPVNVKYVIIPKNHSLFATAGLSSYFMRRENYDYEYVQNNQPGGHNYLSYENETKNWFSVVNISIGYAHKLGAVGSFRIEPYLKLPINKLGVGNLPIMSTGLNIGFTKQLSH